MCQESVKPGMVVHACSPSTLDELEDNLGYRENSSSGWVIPKEVQKLNSSKS